MHETANNMDETKANHTSPTGEYIQPLSEFSCLKPWLRIYEPEVVPHNDSEPTPTNSQPPPSLVVLLSWTGATDNTSRNTRINTKRFFQLRLSC
jgi:hypothetical protein